MEGSEGARQRAVFAGLVGAILGFVLGLWLFSFFGALAVGLGLGLAAWAGLHRSALRGGAGVGSAAAGALPAESSAPWVEPLQQLLRLNLELRMGALEPDVVRQLEEIVDDLRDLIPGLCEDHAGSELTWTVKRMAEDYLPRVLGPFLALSSAERAQHRDEFVKSLAGLEAELAGIRGLVRDAKVGEFQAKAAFLRARFLDADAR